MGSAHRLVPLFKLSHKAKIRCLRHPGLSNQKLLGRICFQALLRVGRTQLLVNVGLRLFLPCSLLVGTSLRLRALLQVSAFLVNLPLCLQTPNPLALSAIFLRPFFLTPVRRGFSAFKGLCVIVYTRII